MDAQQLGQTTRPSEDRGAGGERGATRRDRQPPLMRTCELAQRPVLFVADTPAEFQVAAPV
jgi:hypothetical protein